MNPVLVIKNVPEHPQVLHLTLTPMMQASDVVAPSEVLSFAAVNVDKWVNPLGNASKWVKVKEVQQHAVARSRHCSYELRQYMETSTRRYT